MFAECIAEKNCEQCTAMASECTSCDTTAAEPLYLRDIDKACVTEPECNEAAAPFYWDGTLEACTCKILKLFADY